MSTNCPKCGGAERRILSPGYFECTSSVLTNVVPAGAQGNAVQVPIYGVCGRRYQEGSASDGGPQCACGMFAVGLCATCGNAICGDHGRQSNMGFICNAHIIWKYRKETG
jgi:hypothetical protein